MTTLHGKHIYSIRHISSNRRRLSTHMIRVIEKEPHRLSSSYSRCQYPFKFQNSFVNADDVSNMIRSVSFKNIMKALHNLSRLSSKYARYQYPLKLQNCLVTADVFLYKMISVSYKSMMRVLPNLYQ